MDFKFDVELTNKISNLLLKIGFRASLSGFVYCKYGIKYCYYRQGHRISFMKDVYAEIALAFNSSVSNVERSIRHAINQMWNSPNSCKLNKILGLNANTIIDCPSNSEFILLITEHLINNPPRPTTFAV